MDPPPDKDSIGHFALVTLNLRDESFQYIDSIYNSKDTGGWKIFNRMITNIKKLWEDACQDMVVPLSPLTLDKHVSNKQYMKSPKQNNGLVLTLFFHSISGSTCLCCFISFLFLFFYLCRSDCGFFMLVVVDSWDGISLTDFTYKDIPNIKKTVLFSWMTTNLYQVDFYELFGYKPGMS
jgi:hypothetical protein